MSQLVEGGIMRTRIHLDSPPDHERRSNHYEDLKSFEFDDFLQFQAQKLVADDYCAAYSLPSSMCRSPTDSEYEVSHLLSYNHHTPSSSSSSSRLQTIKDGRKVLMKLTQNMPESSYELSLKDIIDDQQSFKEEARKCQVNLPEKNNNTRRRVQSSTSRINNMNSRIFMIKMFIPVALGFKTKVKNRSCSRILPRTLMDGSAKPITKDEFSFKMASSNKKDTSINKSTSRKKSSKSM